MLSEWPFIRLRFMGRMGAFLPGSIFANLNIEPSPPPLGPFRSSTRGCVPLFIGLSGEVCISEQGCWAHWRTFYASILHEVIGFRITLAIVAQILATILENYAWHQFEIWLDAHWGRLVQYYGEEKAWTPIIDDDQDATSLCSFAPRSGGGLAFRSWTYIML